MKKVMAIFMVMVFAFIFGSMAYGEKVVKDHYGFEVQGWIEEWAHHNGYDRYIDESRILDENGYYRGYGLVDNGDFVNEYGIEFNEDTCCDVLASHYKGLEMEIKLIGFYENYEVYLMKCKADEPIGSVYSEGKTIDYCAGEVIFMICE